MNKLAKKRVAILVADGFEQSEFTEPKKCLEAVGVETVVVSPQPDYVRGFHHHDKGDMFSVDMLVRDTRSEDFDALLLPGGVLNPDALRGNQACIDFARSFFDQHKPVFAICHGPQLLISADVVRGRTLTSYKTVKIDLENAGATWVDESVVVDNGLVTSRSPDDLADFNAMILEELAEGRHERQHA